MSEQKKNAEPVLERNCQPYEHMSQVWDARVATGTTLDDLLDPTFWCNVARILKPLHEVRVVSKDFKLYARLLVGNVVTGELPGQMPQATMVVLVAKDLSKQPVTKVKESDFEIKWHSDETKYAIFRKRTNEIVQGGFVDEAAAALGLKDQLAKLASPIAA